MAYGYAPYEEAAARGTARVSMLQRLGQILSGAGQGIALGRYGQSPLESAALGFSGGFAGATAARQAAEQYAMKQIEAQRANEERQSRIALQQAQIENYAKQRPEKPSEFEQYQAMTPEDRKLYSEFKTVGKEPKQPSESVSFDDWMKMTPAQRADYAKFRQAGATAADTGDSFFQSYVTTTRSGKPFLDMTELTGRDHGAALRWAASKGIPAISSANVAQLQDIDAAKGNIEDMIREFRNVLPSDAQRRIAAIPGIRLSSLLQTNAQRAAFGAWRTSAIRNLRAVAGSKGLRLNQKEIDLAVKNDIPQITDTAEVAQTKMNYILEQLENAENPILLNKWGGGGIPQPNGKPDFIYDPATDSLVPAK